MRGRRVVVVGQWIGGVCHPRQVRLSTKQRSGGKAGSVGRVEEKGADGRSYLLILCGVGILACEH